jgi:hypothetical protein
MYKTTLEDFKYELQKMSEMALYLEFSNILGDIEILEFQKKTKSDEDIKSVVDVENDLAEAYTRANMIVHVVRKFGVTTTYSIDTIDTAKLQPFSDKMQWWVSYWKKWEDNTDPKIIQGIRTGAISKDESRNYFPSGSWRDAYYDNKKN